MNVKKYVRALLWLYLTLIIAMDAVKAQPLKVGDTLPQELWNIPLQVLNHPTGKQTLTLNEYKDKLIILDFWATWCAPCIKSLTKLDTLQKEFGEQLAVVPVTYENGEKVQALFQKRGWSLPSVVGDSVLKRWFPHTSVPHQIWIQDGRVLIFTHGDQPKQISIAEVLKKRNATHLVSKTDDLEYNATKPLIFNNNGGGISDLKNYSVLTGYLEGLYDGGGIRTDSLKRKNIKVVNADLSRLYRVAASRYDSRLMYENRVDISDEKMRELIINPDFIAVPSQRDHIFSYEVLAQETDNSTLSAYMINDLNRYFKPAYGIIGEIVTKDKPCRIIRISDREGIQHFTTKGGKTGVEFIDDRFEFKNYLLSDIIRFLEKFYSSSELPLIDETDGRLSLDLSIPVDPLLRNFAVSEKYLENTGLSITREEREILVLRFSTVNAGDL